MKQVRHKRQHHTTQKRNNVNRVQTTDHVKFVIGRRPDWHGNIANQRQQDFLLQV